MTRDAGTKLSDGTRHGALWAGLLLPPVAALVALEAGYVLVERGCATGQMLPMHLSFLGCLVAALGAGALGWREWRRRGGRLSADEGGSEGRSRFLALLGLIGAPLFALTIAAQWSASLFLHPCQ